MAPILPTTAYLLGLVLETLFYGVYIVLFILSMYFLVSDGGRKRRDTGMSKSIILVTSGNILLFATITAEWIIINVRSFTGFIGRGGEPDGPLLYFSSFNDGTTTAVMALCVVEAAVANYIIMYRLWIVWQRKWWTVAFPVCTHLGTLISGAVFVYRMHKLTPDENFFEPPCEPWIASCLTCSTATNIYCSGLLSYKVLRAQRELRRAQTTYLRSTVTSRIATIIIESALLFTAQSTIITISYFTHSFAVFACMGIAVPFIGISYCLIIVRFGLNGAFRTGRPALSSIYLPPLQSSRSASVAMPMVIDMMRQSGAVGMDNIESATEISKAGTLRFLRSKRDRSYSPHALTQNSILPLSQP
ncbi:uncharacterized protein PHACADRAFT_203588 [Phanerochaete carnosa HHB-10118-sp]|uniref:Uncharacterized protein n=1 Tax=Phanerochaete carnosa (strain HHB-10118-sp) TaxID=650164 RepID=K5WMH5_PHACS|nr:uncharacterized protein PHACADRAFT_203588 [Phanerochaete carnosa HHB-10118-sp]EKM60374.1 hypothetical protein PHACADRAFT_203588 [Phanerochaete carnosa HHB-10118-sp]